MTIRFEPYGERSYLLQGLTDADLEAVRGAVEGSPPEGLEEYVFGYDSCLLIFCRPVNPAVVSRWLNRRSASKRASAFARTVDVPVCYNGADLKAVAALSGLTEREVVEVHLRGEYRVRMMGFAPGFPYLDGLDPRLHLDRRKSPRTHIAPGSVAIGGTHAGIYSVASPGGWHLLGHTDLKLFRPERAQEEPLDAEAVFALVPGDRVKFVEV